VVRRHAARRQPHRRPGDDHPPATPLRGRAPDQLGRLGAAIGPGRVPDRDPCGGAVHPGA
jgi:hypothetical protein